MTRLRWSARARADLDEVGDYWLAHNPPGLLALADRIDDAAAFLLETPGAGPTLGNGPLRKWLVRGTDYILIYRHTRTDIQIVRLRHARQNWRRKAP